ncbi:hypothetical protein MRX96_011407 [Rhipicephalus microplus]
MIVKKKKHGRRENLIDTTAAFSLFRTPLPGVPSFRCLVKSERTDRSRVQGAREAMRESRGPKVCAPRLRPSSKAPAGFIERRLPLDLLSIVTCRSTTGGRLLLRKGEFEIALFIWQTSARVCVGEKSRRSALTADTDVFSSLLLPSAGQAILDTSQGWTRRERSDARAS